MKLSMVASKSSWTASQTADTFTARPGGNANRDYDSDEVMFDSHGNFLTGRLETDQTACS